jgi:heterodisulfide reductase subunit A-like polyferredoxin/coenzyme F420-reducing hydrogenase delta subunit
MTALRTGVFICHCGDNIAGSVDLDRLKKAIASDGVVCVEDDIYLCSTGCQEMIRSRIRSEGLDSVVIAACSPEVHEHLFRDCVVGAGLNRYLMDIANIREQCAWVKSETDPTEKAIDIVRSSIYALRYAQPREKICLPVNRDVMVIGGGIAGITAALSLARQGIRVYLVEKSASIGGNMVKIGKVFSPDKLTEECAMCSLAPILSDVESNKNIELLTLTNIVGTEGHAGDFHVRVSTGPALIDGSKCISCGLCSESCSVSVPDEWNANLSERKAIYRPFPQAVPAAYTIDVDACQRCGNCVETCDAGAIDLERMPVGRTIDVGAIIMATGHREFDPAEKYEFGYGKYQGVITQMELARLLAVNGPTRGKLEIPSTNQKPRRVVMVQCVGSRDKKPGCIPHCSTICCMTALKHANYISNHFSGTEVYICYTDIRAPGTYENYYLEVQKKNVKLLRGRVAEVLEEKEGLLVVRVEDTLGGGLTEIETDMVVLSCALMPSAGTVEVANMLGVSLTPELFVQEKHPKMEPTQTSSAGIFVCGTAEGAKDITASISQSRSAASKAVELVSAGAIEVEPKYAVIDPQKCEGCGTCARLCLYGAPYENGRMTIDPLACTGLGECVALCPQQAISLPGCSDEEIYARIDGCLSGDGPRIIAFLDEKIAYVAADNVGVNRIAYPPEVRIVRVPSVMRLDTGHLLYAFRKGALGIFLGDGTANASGGAVRPDIAGKAEQLRQGVARAGIDADRVFYYEAYLPHFKGLALRLDEFSVKLKAFDLT